MVNGGGDRRDRDGAGRHGCGRRLAGAGGSRRSGDGGGRRGRSRGGTGSRRRGGGAGKPLPSSV